MEPWIGLSVAAAAFQTLRFMLQKRLSMGALSAGGATLARFVYAAPFIAALAVGYLIATGTPWPVLTSAFWAYAGGILLLSDMADRFIWDQNRLSICARVQG